MAAAEITGTDQRAAWTAGVMPPVERVRDGLWSIPVPIPNNPLRYVLVYALELDDGVAVVDCGWNTEAAWEALCGGLRTAGFAITDVRAALITHIHPDHYGLAGRLRETSGAWVALHPADAALIPGRYGYDIDAVVSRMRELLVDCGVPADTVSKLTDASMGIRDWVSAAEPDVLFEHGERIDLRGWDLVPLHTPGHSPGHVCFYERERRLLLSGDHVLPRISPNISVHAQQADNPLADFLDALRRVRDLEVGEVLPAHEWRFAALPARIDELVQHHEQRLATTAAILREHPGSSCWEVTRSLSWSRDWSELGDFMRRAAVGETLAHLVLLRSRGLAREEPGKPRRWYPDDRG